MKNKTSFIHIILLFLTIFCIPKFVYAGEPCNPEEIKENIKKLADTNYKNREVAKKELSKLPNNCRKLLVAELKLTQNLEVKERLQDILNLSKDNLIELFSEFYLTAQNLLKEEKFDEALNELNKIFEIDDEYEMAHELKYKILEAKGDYKKCIEIIQKKQASFAENSKEFMDTSMQILQLQVKDNNYKEAINFLENKNINKIENDRLNLFLSNLYELNNQPNKAEEIQLKIQAKFDKGGSNSNIAWFYIRQNAKEKAKTYLQKSTEEKTDSLTQVLDYFYLGNTQKSLELITKKSDELLNELKDQKDISIININDNDVLLLFYRNYFEYVLKKSQNIKFKALYESFSNDAKKVWPIPLLGYYGNVLTLEQIEVIMNDNNPYERRQKRTEGYFYIGLLKICEGNQAEAKKYFALSKDQQIFDYIETTASFYFINN